MANHANSVFGASAIARTWLSTTRIPAYNTGSDGNGYVEGFPSYADLNNLPAIPFRPTDKYSPVRMTVANGWANGSKDDGAAAKHDASAGAVPSFTSARKGDICIVTVAGTLGSRSVSKGDYLQALTNDPTLESDWAVITDCSAEFEALVLSAKGAEIELIGTYKMRNANSNRLPINFSRSSRFTLLNECGYPAIYTSDNNGFSASSSTSINMASVSVDGSVTFTVGTGYDFRVGEFAYCKSSSSRYIGMVITAYSGGDLTGTVLYYTGTSTSASWTINSGGAASAIQVKCASAGAGAGTGLYVDDEIGSTLCHTTYLEMSTAGHENYFFLGAMVQIFTNNTHVSDGACFTNVGRVTSIDTTNHRVYLDRVVQFHDQIANASAIYLHTCPDTMQVNIPDTECALLMGGPTIIGESVGWYLDLFGDTDESATVSWVEGGKRRLTFASTPNYLVNQGIHITGLSGADSKTTRRVLAFDNTAKTVDVEVTDDAKAVTSGVTDSVSIGTGSKSFTVGSGKGFVVGQTAEIVATSDTTKAMFGSITSYSGSTLTVNVTDVLGSGTFAGWKVYMNTGDTGKGCTVPLSGTVNFRAAFWTSEFDTTTHGGSLVMNHVNGSDVNFECARLWSSAGRFRFSHYTTGTSIVLSKNAHVGTGISGKSWRLNYIRDNYCSCLGRGKVIGGLTRHDTAGGGTDTSSTWEPNFWISKTGMALEGDFDTDGLNSLGATGDTHSHQSGSYIKSRSRFPTAMNTAHSYRGLGAQIRAENEIRHHIQEGGQTGIRIANSSSYKREPGSVDTVILESFNMPMRSDAHAFQLNTSGAVVGSISNTPFGFVMQDQSGYTGGTSGDKTVAVGRLFQKNAGGGFYFDKSTKGDLTESFQTHVGYAGGMINDGANVRVADIDLSYIVPNGVETTSTTSHTLATGSASLTVGTSLNIKAGQRALVQDNTGASADVRRANYEWGRVVSYNSGTGDLVLYIEGVKGSKSSGTAWRVTIGVDIPRFGIVMAGTSRLDFGVMKWRVGKGSNPEEFFFNYDTSGVKTVRGGVLVINDPDNYGMPELFRNGASAYFDVQISTIIYNGQVILDDVTQLADTESFVVSTTSGLKKIDSLSLIKQTPDNYTKDAFIADTQWGGVMQGINLCGAEFDTATVPGVYGTNWAYPDNDSVDYFIGKGFKLIRIPFRWERIQYVLGGALEPNELLRLKTLVSYITSSGGKAILDVHNFASYKLQSNQTSYKIGASDGHVTIAHFRDLWERLAEEFKDNPDVIFDLMNEPNGMEQSTHWFNAAQQAILGIRSVGAYNRIYVPGYYYSKAETFVSVSAKLLEESISDPANNMAVTVHMYLDNDGAGDSNEVAYDTKGSERLRNVTQWARLKGYKLQLGECNGGDNSSSSTSVPVKALQETHDYIVKNQDVWEGYTLWAGGDRWGDSYINQLQPIGGPTSGNPDRTRMTALIGRNMLSYAGDYPASNEMIDLDFVNNTVFGIQRFESALSLTQAGITMKPNLLTGAWETVPAGTLRICPGAGLLAEEARTNYVPSVFLGSTSNVVMNRGKSSPDGNRNALLLRDDGTSALHRVTMDSTVYGAGVFVSGDPVCMSVFAREYESSTISTMYGYIAWSKPDSCALFDINNYAYPSDSPVMKDNWRRGFKFFTGAASAFPETLEVNLQPDATPDQANTSDTYQSDGNSGIYYWHLQVEKGYYPTSPIFNNKKATAVTRAADVIQIVGRSLELLQGDFTFIIETTWMPNAAIDLPFLTLTDATSSKVMLRREENYAIGGDTSKSTGAVVLGVGSTSTFTRSTGSFITDGFAAGMQIETSGFANAANNGTFTISSLTATVITLTTSTLTTETGSGDEIIKSVLKSAVPTNGVSEWYLPRKSGLSVKRSATNRVVVGYEGVSSVGVDVSIPATTAAVLGPVGGFIRSIRIYPSFNDTTALDALLAAP